MNRNLFWRVISAALSTALIITLASAARTTVAQRDDDLPPVGTFAETPCRDVLPPSVVDAVDHTVTCGYVTVPEHHAAPDGPAMRVAVTVIASTSPAPAPDPLVIESGGPGFPSLWSVPSVMQMADYRAARDLVIVEQRGIGASGSDLTCPEGERFVHEMYGQSPTDDEVRQLELDVWATCLDQWSAEGIDLSAYTSVENAADFPIVMHALGYDSYNFYGVSYASVLGQHIMRDHPEGLRSVILDSVVPMAGNFAVNAPMTTDRAFDLLFATCAADPVCGDQFPDLEPRFYALVEQYDATPVTVTRPNPFTGAEVEAVITGEMLIMAVYEALYTTVNIPLLPAALDALDAGDLYFLDTMTPSSRISLLRMTSGMSNSVICSEWPVSIGPVPDGIHPAVTRTLQFYMDYTHLCAVWPVEPLSESIHTPVTSDIPTLILSGEYDPITPPENGAAIMPALSHAVRYVFPGAGHGALGSSLCALDIGRQFLDDPVAAPDASCIESLGVTFARSLDTTAGLVLVPVTLDTFDIQTVVPQGWQALDEGTFGSPGLTVLLAAFSEQTMADIRAPFDSFATLPGEDLTVNGRTWRRHHARLRQYDAVVFTTEGGPGYYVIGLLDSTGNLDALVEAILLPAVEAFAVVP